MHFLSLSLSQALFHYWREYYDINVWEVFWVVYTLFVIEDWWALVSVKPGKPSPKQYKNKYIMQKQNVKNIYLTPLTYLVLAASTAKWSRSRYLYRFTPVVMASWKVYLYMALQQAHHQSTPFLQIEATEKRQIIISRGSLWRVTMGWATWCFCMNVAIFLFFTFVSLHPMTAGNGAGLEWDELVVLRRGEHPSTAVFPNHHQNTTPWNCLWTMLKGLRCWMTFSGYCQVALFCRWRNA